VHLFRLATDCKVGLPINQQRQPLADNRMIVNYEYGFLSCPGKALFACLVIMSNLLQFFALLPMEKYT